MTTDPNNPRLFGGEAEDHREMQAPAWLRGQIAAIEDNAGLDPLGERLHEVASRVAAGSRGDALRGQWLGHALHPLLTDLPLGCWFSAAVLDVFGGRSSRRAAQRLVGTGLLLVPPTVASGLTDWKDIRDPKARRVGIVHALGNSVVGLLYFLSWRSRRRAHHLRGMLFGMLGGLGAIATGYLGGHLSFGRNVGAGQRGMDLDVVAGPGRVVAGEEDATGNGGGTRGAAVAGEAASSDSGDTAAQDTATPLVGLSRASELIGVPVEQVRSMVDEGMLEVVATKGGEPQFREDDVLALRMLGS
ncbi:MAG TPA: DUF2231 domain-containing protein [Acidimicrobiales bacterium]